MRNYLSSVIAKTGTRNRLEALRAAEDAGWLEQRRRCRLTDVGVARDRHGA